MTTPRSYLTELHIRELAGIDRPFSITSIQPGLNVVLGPNGSGKTSLCRAISALLWAGPSQRGESIRAVWVDGGTRLEAARNSGVTTWTRDSIRENLPPPPEYLAECFLIRMEDLLPVSRARGSLESQIDLEMDGGFDLESLLKRQDARLSSTQLRDLKSAMKSAEAARANTLSVRHRENR